MHKPWDYRKLGDSTAAARERRDAAVMFSRLSHTGVLNGADRDLFSRETAEDRVATFGGPGGEDDPLGLDRQDLSEALAGIFEGSPGGGCLPIEAGRIVPVAIRRLEVGLAGRRAERCRCVVVEVSVHSR